MFSGVGFYFLFYCFPFLSSYSFSDFIVNSCLEKSEEVNFILKVSCTYGIQVTRFFTDSGEEVGMDSSKVSSL